jgi:hypothetical protein
MRNIIQGLKLIASALLFLLFTSCSDWLEVGSSSEVTEEDLFAKPEGYRVAVNGVYRLLSEPALYGRNLTWGVASVLGNNYNASQLPSGSTIYNLTDYRGIAAHEYTSAASVALIDPIWEAAYKVIANCNNIIAYTEQQAGSFFLAGEIEKNTIRGEMLGLRAMMHFDLLRLFAPAVKADDGKTHIPYLTSYPDREPVHLTVSAALERVIADLEQARTLLAGIDTVATNINLENIIWYFPGRIQFISAGFFEARSTRMNFFAVSAILARAYQWRDQPGDSERAYRAARDIYRFSTEQPRFSFTPADNLVTAEYNVFRKMPHDILLAFHNKNMYDIIEKEITFRSGAYYSFAYKNITELFAGDLDDFRLTALINADNSSRRWSIPTSNQTSPITADVIQHQGPLAPVVRVSEMYYIMCEYLADHDLPRAISLLQTVRTARGAKTPLATTLTKEAFLEKLYIDMTREFMSEGQTFQLYKRLNRPMYNGAGVIDMTGKYVLPLPHSEISYINL